ncbi:MAG: molybdopterin-dependent oxidoreductase [Dehalococcoidia bacterium]
MRQRLTVFGSLASGLKGLGLGSGIIAGALLTAPLIGLMYLVDKLAGFPFVPFALFDWIARVPPGSVITFGIDLMIDGLRLAGLSVADAAKTGEQIGAVLLLFCIGVAAGAVYFAIIKAKSLRPQRNSGLILGFVVGLPLAIVSLPMGRYPLPPWVVLPGLMLLFLVWGLAFVPVYRSLMRTRTDLLVPPTPEDHIWSVETLNRRQFLIRLGATTATITVLSGGLGALLGQAEQQQRNTAIAGSMDMPKPPPGRVFPNSDDPLVPAPGTRLEYTPVEDHYQVFLNTEPSFIDIATWTLPITGLVNNPLELTIDDLRNNYEPREQYVTLSCISGRIATTLISTTLWTGISLQKILADLQPQAEARYLVISSADGFYETVDLDLIASDERIMLCYAWDGHPIPFDHGFPLRIWLPDRYGMKQPKWITGIEVVAEYEEGYWVRRGWDEVAQVRATSVIDTIGGDHIYQEGDQTLVPVGGIAFAGARGISRVEVRVDGKAWQPAQLRAPLSETTWVIWRYDWPFQSGNHTFEVRCVEGDGTPQIEEEMGNRPSGATGIHQRRERL